jgi:Ca2+-binding RTX toxin-like protein
VANIDGTNNSETIRGTIGSDVIQTLDGNDTVFAADGDDQINGSINANGAYSRYSFLGSKTIYGEGGNDVIIGGDDSDTLDGGAGNDRILSGGGNDAINGGDGDDQINAFVNADGTVSFYSFSGSLTVTGGAGNDAIRGASGSDKIDGGNDNDDLSGLAGDDLISGGNGNDTLYGNDGSDTLDGGAGADKLYGGAGNDYYIIDNLSDYVQDSEGKNTGLIKVDFYKQPTGVTWKLADSVKPLPYWIDALVGAGAKYVDAQNSVTSGIIKYAFPEATLSSWDSGDKLGFTPLNSAQRAFVEKCLAYIETIIDVRFERVSDASQVGVLTFANNQQTGSAGYATGGLSFQKWGVFFNNTGTSAIGNAAPKEGEYAALTFIHEIGHALGLKHPHDGTAGEGNASDPPYLSEQEDVTTFTQLSYTENSEDYVSQFRDLDIAALQYLYGPAKVSGTGKNQTGDTTYTLLTTQRNFIWDGGGTDTLDASNADKLVVLTLEAGTDVNGKHSYFGTAASQYITAAGQITINIGTVIENALGTPYGDIITGNSVSNDIRGNGGNDIISGGQGDDWLYGNAGNDALNGDAGIDRLTGGLGDDTLDGGDGSDIAYYSGEGFTTGITVDLQTGTASGGAGNDRLISVERVWGTEKADKFYGSAGSDVFIGDAGDDYADGRAGTDYFQINNDISECTWLFDGDTCVITTKSLGTDRLDNVESVIFVGKTNEFRTMEELKVNAASNRAPAFLSSSQVISTNEDAASTITVSANDPDGDPLTYTISNSASNGTVSVSGSAVTYTPRANYNGADSFVVRASDGKGGTATQTVNVTVTAVNDAPTFSASSQSVSATAGTAKTITLAATDVDGDALTYTFATPGKGSATISGSTLTYTPTSSASGTDSFVVTARDPSGLTATQTINATVEAATTTTSSTDFRVTTTDGWTGAIGGNGFVFGTSGYQDIKVLSGTITFDASFNKGGDILRFDAAASSYTVLRAGSSAQINAGSNLSAVIPVGTAGMAASFSDGVRKLVFSGGNFTLGAQTFSTSSASISSAADGTILPTGASSSASARITLAGNDLRSGQTSHITIGGKASIFGSTFKSDVVAIAAGVNVDLFFDASFNRGGDTIILDKSAGSYSAIRTGASIILTSTNQTLTIPVGTSSTTIKFADGSRALVYSTTELAIKLGSQVIATTATAITSLNRAPVFLSSSQAFSTNEDTSKTITMNATDQDGDSLTYTVTTAATKGATTVSGNSIIYTPNANYNGADSFVVTASDGKGGTATQTVNVTVAAVDDAPVISAASTRTFTVAEDASATFVIDATDIDTAVASLVASIVTAPANGRISTNAAGGNVYTPNANFNGTDSFVVGVSDGTTRTTYTVNVTVSAVDETVSIDVTDDSTATTYSAAGDIFHFTDNSGQKTNAIITGMTSGDTVDVTGASSNYSFTSVGSDIQITYNNTTAGVLNVIVLKGLAGNRFIADEASAEAAAGWNFFRSAQASETSASASLDVGTPTSTVTISAAGAAFALTDDAKKSSYVKITGFAAGDSIRITGATESQYSFSSSDLDGDGSADDLSISYSDAGSGVVNDIKILSVVSPTAFVFDKATAVSAVGFNFITFG